MPTRWTWSRVPGPCARAVWWLACTRYTFEFTRRMSGNGSMTRVDGGGAGSAAWGQRDCSCVAVEADYSTKTSVPCFRNAFSALTTSLFPARTSPHVLSPPLHQDQATDYILRAARHYGKPFALVPCCVFPSEFPGRRLSNGAKVVTYPQLLEYLANILAPSCMLLPNDVAPGRVPLYPPRSSSSHPAPSHEDEPLYDPGHGAVATHYLPFRGRNKVLYCVS